jgi:hypothetical protein
MSQSCKTLLATVVSRFIQELEIRMNCKNESSINHLKNLLKFAKMLNDEQFKIDNFSCED